MPQTVETRDLLSPSFGASHQVKIHRFGTEGARPKVYLQAALHADEYPGLLVAHHLIKRLAELDDQGAIKGEVIVVPVANPIGLGQRINAQHLGRFDLAGGGNFNRNWPDLSEAVLRRVEFDLTEDPEINAQLIREALIQEVSLLEVRTEFDDLRKTLLLFSIDSDVVLDLHCDYQALFHLYSSIHHKALAHELGCDLGARAVLIETEAGGEPFDECHAGVWWRLKQRVDPKIPIPLACFSATVELRGQQDVSDDLASKDAQALIRFMQRRQVIVGDPGPLPGPLCSPTPLEGTDIIYAPSAGVLVYHKKLGDKVSKGEIVAELIDPTAESQELARTPLISRTSGLFLTHITECLVAPGASLIKICGEHPLEHRESGKLLEAK
jgi:predicted deacylase